MTNVSDTQESLSGGDRPQPMADRRSALSIVGIIITLGFPNLPISQWMDEFAIVAHLVGYELIWWAMVVMVFLYVVLLEERTGASLGFRALRKFDLIIAIVSAIVMCAGLAAIYFLVFPLLGISETPQIDRLLATPFWWRVIPVIRAGVSDVLLFRGYALVRIGEVTGSVRVASIVSCAAFAIAHVGPWGWAHLLIASFGGIVLTALYLWRRNLWVNMITHVLVDAAAVLPA